MLRCLRYVVEFIAAFVSVVVVLALLLVWRVSVKPVSSTFMTPYIESGIEGIVRGSTVSVASSTLLWDKEDHSILLRVENVDISDQANHQIASIPVLQTKISAIGLLFGQFLPSDMDIEHPQIRLEHSKIGAYAFGGMAMTGDGASVSAPTDLSSIKDVFQNAFHALLRTALLHRLEITHAIVDVHDQVTQKDWMIGIPDISVKRIGSRESIDKWKYGALEGHVTLEVTQKEGVASVEINYSYNPQKKRHSLTALFNDLTPAYLAGGHPETLGLAAAAFGDLPLTGKIYVTLDEEFAFKAAAVQIHGDQGAFVDTDLWDKPLAVKSLDINADYDGDAHTLSMNDIRLDLGDAVFGVDVKGVPSTHAGQDLDLSAHVTADNLPMNRYSDVWPKPVIANARYWLVQNLRDGVFKHADVQVNGSLAWNDLDHINVTDGGGTLSAVGARITYLDGMPAAEGVNAEASFDLKKMSVLVTNGGLSNIRLQPFTVEITGLADEDQYIHIPLKVAGPVPDILRLIDHPPLGYAKALGITPDDVQGTIDGVVDFRLPLVKTLLMKDVELHATANATGVASAKLVPGIAVDQGAVVLTLDMSGFAMKGQANLNTLPFQISWQEYFDNKPNTPSRLVSVTGTIKDNQWDQFGIHLLDGSKGAMPVTLDMKRFDKKNVYFSGRVDMTPAAAQVDMVGWKKAGNVPAVLSFAATSPLKGNVKITKIDVRGDHVRVNGDAEFSPDMSQLLSINLPVFVLGRSNASVQYSQSFGENGAVQINANGVALDVSGMNASHSDPDEGSASTPDLRPQKYVVNVDRLYTSSNGEIDKAQGSATRDTVGWRAISLHGLANGDKPLSIELTPQPDGRATFLIASDDFGEAMQGLGFTDAVKGGKLTITGQSAVDNPRLIEGHAKISAFSIEKLPVLMLLLNATSPFGFSGLLTDSADFSRFEGDFHWQGDMITLTRAHAAGAAVGINVDGKVDMNTGNANLQGTLVPFSTVNNMLNYIPLIGDLLTGGQDQGVLAVSYTIKGALSSPKISVNPVSLLTPGFIRNLFFRDDAADDNN